LVNNFSRVSNAAIVAAICCLFLGCAQIHRSDIAGKVTTQNATNEISDREGNVKKIVLFVHDAVLQVAPDNQLKPGGVLYEAMTFNCTILGP
jgi:hypothetical protein